MKSWYFLFLFSLIFPLDNLHADIGDDITAPIHYEESEKVLLIGASATLLTSIFKNTLNRNIQRELNEDHPLCCNLTKPGNTYLQILPNILYTFSYGINYFINNEDDSKRKAIGMVKATAYADLWVEILKRSINERRPQGASTESFPSGHTSSAFAFASYVASEHPWYVGVPAYVMASYVGFCRMQDNHHYLNDVIAGATIGMSYGIATSLESKKVADKKSALMIFPTDDNKGIAFQYTLKFN